MIAGFLRGRSGAAHTTVRRRSRRERRGQALVEFALIFPVFMLILAGILDFGFMLYSRMTVINAAREGAHVVLSDAIKNDAVLIANIPARVSSTVGGVAQGVTLTTVTECVQPNSSACSFSGSPLAASGDSVKVTVTHTYKAFFPLLFGQTFDLTSTVQMVLE